jgi:two-component system response regulator HydG
MLETYDWPDNVQELEDTIAHACSQMSGPELEPIHLPRKLLRFHRNATKEQAMDSFSNGDPDNPSEKRGIIPIAKVEERVILEALQETNGDKQRAAELLGIGKTTMYRKLKEYGVCIESHSTAVFSLPAALNKNTHETQSISSCA